MIISRWALVVGVTALLIGCQNSEMKSSDSKNGETNQAGKRDEVTTEIPGGGKSVVKTGTEAFDNPIIVGPQADSRSLTQLLCQEGPKITEFAGKSDFSPEWETICGDQDTNDFFYSKSSVDN